MRFHQRIHTSYREKAAGKRSEPHRPVHGLPPFLQRKPAGGRSSGPLEDEAERVERSVASAGAGMTQGKCSCGGTCAKCREEEGPQRKAEAPGSADSAAGAPDSVHEALRAPGRPLDAAARARLEPLFHQDFSRVRVHADQRAAQSATDIHALAYTSGSDMVFAAGQYDPHSQKGTALIAHELTHVVQQSGPGEDLLQRKPEDAASQCGGTWTCAANPCALPDPGREGNGGTPTGWTLTIMIDAEAPSADEVTGSSVGHTYVEFSDSTGAAYTYGFYPNKSYGTPDPLFHPEVPGCVVHADTNHAGCVDYKEKVTLAQPDYEKALKFAQANCGSPPRYNLQTNNCTTFARDVSQIAGHSLPPIRGKVGRSVLADNPYTLIENLRRRDTGPTYNLTSDSDIRDAIAGAAASELAAIPVEEKIRVINRLLDGWVSDDDLQAIETLCANVATSAEMIQINHAVHKREGELNDAQGKRFHAAISRGI